MRVAIRILGVFFVVVLLASTAYADRTLVIERFDATITVAADGSIEVQETIVPRFTGSWNGIYRTIPVEYRTPQGLNYTLRLSLESITDGAGTPLKYESSRVRHYRKFKIWVPGAQDATRTVQIRYRVANALRFFDEHDELYWNITGDEWDVPIESASASIALPDGVSGVRATAFRGEYGSTEQNEVVVGNNAVTVLTKGLGLHEGLTIVAGWNPGVVHRPNAIDNAADVLYSNWPLLLPFVAAVLMFLRWRSRGRDPKVAPVITRYEPPEAMSPAELGTLADGKVDMRDITATIVDLAVRGYVHIEQTSESHFLFKSTDYTFRLMKSRTEWQGLKPHERDLLDALFDGGDTVTLSDLKNKFYKHLPGLRDKLYDHLVDSGCYGKRPDKVTGGYTALAVIVAILIAWLGGKAAGAAGLQPLPFIIGGILTGVVIFLFGTVMPARTVHGTRELEKVLGFQEFLARVESDRLNRVVKTPEMFEKFLPFAMALGVESNWAAAFEGIYKQPPTWYTGPVGSHTFSPRGFTSDVSRMSATAASVMASAPRGSGGSGFSGGSSGGGFGGGGGGGF